MVLPCCSGVPVLVVIEKEERFSSVVSPPASCVHVWRIWHCYVISVRGGCSSIMLYVKVHNEGVTDALDWNSGFLYYTCFNPMFPPPCMLFPWGSRCLLFWYFLNFFCLAWWIALFAQLSFLQADKSIKGGHPGYNIIIFHGSVTSHDHSRAKFQC